MTQVKNLRYYVAAAVFFTASSIHLTRSVINIAIPEMTMTPNVTEDKSSFYRLFNLNNFDQPHFTDIIRDIYKSDERNHFNRTFSSGRNSTDVNGDADETSDNYFQQLAKTKYNWEQSTAGMIQSAFFVGYMMLQIPAATMAEKYGAKRFILVCAGSSAIITMLTPFLAFTPIVLMITRLIMGLGQSALTPSIFVVLISWLPPKDRTFGLACLLITGSLGAVIMYLSSGPIIDNFGWPSLFWFAGASCALATLVAAIFLTSTPDDHPFISPEELTIIKGDDNVEMSPKQSTNSTQVTFVNGSDDKAIVSINENAKSTDRNSNRLSVVSINETNETVYDESIKDEKKIKPPIPWMDIFTNRSFIVAFFFKIIWASTFQLFYSKLPIFLKEIMHQSPNENGFINAGLQSVLAVSGLFVGSFSEKLINRAILSRTKTRRLCGFISGAGQALCLVFIAICARNDFAGGVVAAILTGGVFASFVVAAETPLPAEISKNFGATIYAIFNMGSMLPGIIVPYLVGVILDWYKDDEVTGWCIVFYSAATIMIMATIPFSLLVSAKRQPFDMIKEDIPTDKARSASAASYRYSIG